MPYVSASPRSLEHFGHGLRAALDLQCKLVTALGEHVCNNSSPVLHFNRKFVAALGEGGCVSAKPKALPMNGAVHGVATIAAKTPVKKEPARPARRERP